MCIDAKTSITVFVMSLIFVGILWFRNKGPDKWIAATVLSYAYMQWLEYKMWTDIDCVTGENEFATKQALILLWIQPLVQFAGAAWFTGKRILWLIASVYAIYLIKIISIVSKNKNGDWCSQPGEFGSLEWNRPDRDGFLSSSIVESLFYHLGIIIPMLFMRPLKLSIPLILFGIISMLLTYQIKHKGEAGSLWCIVMNLYGLVAIVLNR